MQQCKQRRKQTQYSKTPSSADYGKNVPIAHPAVVSPPTANCAQSNLDTETDEDDILDTPPSPRQDNKRMVTPIRSPIFHSTSHIAPNWSGEYSSLLMPKPLHLRVNDMVSSPVAKMRLVSPRAVYSEEDRVSDFLNSSQNESTFFFPTPRKLTPKTRSAKPRKGEQYQRSKTAITPTKMANKAATTIVTSSKLGNAKTKLQKFEKPLAKTRSVLSSCKTGIIVRVPSVMRKP